MRSVERIALSVVVLTITVWACAGARAEAAHTGLLEKLRTADANKDGKVTLEELQAVAPRLTAERFETLDRDRDGAIGRGDIRRLQARRWAQRIGKADANGDGRVTFEEMRAAAPRLTPERYSKLDIDHDGVLTRQDRLAMEGRGRFLARLRQADANGDSRITFDEAKTAFPKMTRDRFGRLDRNGDGALDKEDGAARARQG